MIMNTDHMMTSMTGMFSSALAASPIALATCVPPIFLKLTQGELQKRDLTNLDPDLTNTCSRQTESPPPPQAQQLWPTNTMREVIAASYRRRRLSLRCKLLSPLRAFPLPFACHASRQFRIWEKFDASNFPLSDLPFTLSMSHKQAI